jgi:hypothetical protein
VHPGLLEPLRERALEAAPQTGRFQDRLYIDRGANRGVQNHDEMLELLARYDIQVVQPESMTAAEQIDAFQSARLMIGEHGAGLSNMIFSRNPREASIVEIIPKCYAIPTYWILAAGVGTNYYMLPEQGGFEPRSDGVRKKDPVVIDLRQLDGLLSLILTVNPRARKRGWCTRHGHRRQRSRNEFGQRPFCTAGRRRSSPMKAILGREAAGTRRPRPLLECRHQAQHHHGVSQGPTSRGSKPRRFIRAIIPMVEGTIPSFSLVSALVTADVIITSGVIPLWLPYANRAPVVMHQNYFEESRSAPDGKAFRNHPV